MAKPTIAEAIRIQRLYRPREDGESGARRRGQGLPQRSAQDAIESILGKIEAIERHEAPMKLTQGWSQDEAGHWIPPGWKREDKAPEAGAAMGRRRKPTARNDGRPRYPSPAPHIHSITRALLRKRPVTGRLCALACRYEVTIMDDGRDCGRFHSATAPAGES